MSRQLQPHALYAPADQPAGGAGAAGGGAAGSQPAPGAPGAAAGGAGVPGGAAAPTQQPQPPGWMAQFSPESRAVLMGKEFKAPDDVVKHLARLESEAGSGRIVVPDDKSPPETRQAFWKAGGWPDKSDAYELPTENVDPQFVKWARDTFHSEGVSATAAKNIAAKWQGFVEDHMKAQKEAAEQRITEEDAKLRVEWRGDYGKNIDITDRVVKYMGFSDEGLAALADVEGYVKVRQAFLKAAAIFDGANPQPGGGGQSTFSITTPQQAQQELDRMLADPAIAEKLRNGDVALNRRFDELHEIKTGIRLPQHMRGGR